MARGGARKGAGRPKGERQGVAVSFWVTKDTQARLRELRAHGYNTPLLLEEAVEGWYEDMCENEERERG